MLVARRASIADRGTSSATSSSLGIELNVLLAVFNLIPIPPLDGSKVASFGLPGDLGERYDRVVGPVRLPDPACCS